MHFILVNGKLLMSFKRSLRQSDLCFKIMLLLCGKDGGVTRGRVEMERPNQEAFGGAGM